MRTENIPFIFQGQHYGQVDGVAMGSPLGPLLADFFMSIIEERCQQEIPELFFYRRYVDDTLFIAESKDQIQSCIEILNIVHPIIQMTIEYRTLNNLPFLDILPFRTLNGNITRTIYRNATWNGLYTKFQSFTPVQYKRALVKALFYRAWD